MAILSERWITLAILLYDQFIHLTQINLLLNLGKNTFLYCGQIIVVHVYVKVFLKSSPNVSK